MAEKTPAWWQDRALWWATAVGLYLRLLLLVRWPAARCIRDECTYLALSRDIHAGEGLRAAARGWLWAPGYPYFLAAHEALFEAGKAARITQTLLTPIALALAFSLAARVGGRRAGIAAAWLVALSPTLVFFTVSTWSEWLYLTLLMGALAGLGWAREGGVARGLLPGMLVGACVLMRGVATYMLPIFALGALWGRFGARKAYGTAATLVLGAALTVAPWASHASAKWGGLVLSDRTLGQMMWLGNNDFPPVTFDYGNGLTDVQEYRRVTSSGRAHCDFDGNPVTWDACEAANGFAWIQDHPREFLERIPLRLAQLLNPNSFLTRRLRNGFVWRGFPEGLVTPMSALTVAWSAIAVVGGTLGLLARGRGWLAVVTGGILAYHFAAIALVAGLSRYRVPLDGLWLLWAAVGLAAPGVAWAALREQPWRGALAFVLLCVLIPLMLWFLPMGFPT